MHVPAELDNLRFISIDPGTKFTGIAVYEFNIFTHETKLLDAQILTASSNSGFYKKIAEVHGDLLARVMYLGDELTKYYHFYKPQMVICESSFMGKFADAFEALVQCIHQFKIATLNWNENIPFDFIDPTSVKRNLNAILRGEESKNSVREKVLELGKNKEIITDVDLSSLGEHAIDAVAVGWHKVCKLKELLNTRFYNVRKNNSTGTDIIDGRNLLKAAAVAGGKRRGNKKLK